MTNLNAKTDPAHKGKTITAAVMTLTAAAVVTMAPMSQAFAGYFNAEGTGWSKAKAEENARSNAKKKCIAWGTQWGQPTQKVKVTNVILGKAEKIKYSFRVPVEFDCIYN